MCNAAPVLFIQTIPDTQTQYNKRTTNKFKLTSNYLLMMQVTVHHVMFFSCLLCFNIYFPLNTLKKSIQNKIFELLPRGFQLLPCITHKNHNVLTSSPQPLGCPLWFTASHLVSRLCIFDIHNLCSGISKLKAQNGNNV